MRVTKWAADPGQAVSRYGSVGAAYSALARMPRDSALGLMRLHGSGRVGRHPAPCPQLALIVAGTARVSGGDGVPVNVREGDMVLWEAGEEHETSSENGVDMLIVEADALSVTLGANLDGEGAR